MPAQRRWSCTSRWPVMSLILLLECLTLLPLVQGQAHPPPRLAALLLGASPMGHLPPAHDKTCAESNKGGNAQTCVANAAQDCHPRTIRYNPSGDGIDDMADPRQLKATRTARYVQPLVAPNNLVDDDHNDNANNDKTRNERNNKPTGKSKGTWGWNKPLSVKQPKRLVEVLGNGPEIQDQIQNGSDDLYKVSKYDLIPEECTPQYEWQTQTLCTCNTVHEHSDLLRQQLQRINHGYQLVGLDNIKNAKKLKRKNNNPQPVVVPQWWYSDQEYNLYRDLGTDSTRSSNDDDEVDSDSDEDEGDDFARLFLGSGFYRSAWWLFEWEALQDGVDYVLKTLHYKDTLHYTHRNQERHRRDALVADRLSQSLHTTKIYAYCGNSALYQFAPGGSLQDNILRDIEFHSSYSSSEDSSDNDDDNLSTSTARRRKIKRTKPNPKYPPHGWTSRKQIVVAYQVVSAVADMHTTDHPERSAIAHTDISLGQFLDCEYEDNDNTEWVDYRLNDFNRVRLLHWNQDTQQVCPFRVGGHKGRNRSPEEYLRLEETEKEDIYSMGNILYTIVTGNRVFEDKTAKVAQQLIKEGARPVIDDFYRKSDDRLIQALITAIDGCWMQNPAERPSAKEIQNNFAAAIENEKRLEEVENEKLFDSDDHQGHGAEVRPEDYLDTEEAATAAS